jgi:hypothetical protein
MQWAKFTTCEKLEPFVYIYFTLLMYNVHEKCMFEWSKFVDLERHYSAISNHL